MSEDTINVFVGWNPWKATQTVISAFIPMEDQVGQRAEIDQFQASTYGKQIPLLYGEYNRLAGNVIYFDGIVETEHSVKHTNGSFASSTYTIWYTYSITTIAIAIGRKIRNVKTIWANKKIVYLHTQPLTVNPIPDAGHHIDLTGTGVGNVYSDIYLYNGSDTQNSSPGIPDATKPGYRGVSYIVFKNFQVEDFGNSVPNFEFEIDAGPTNLYEIIKDLCENSGLQPHEYEINIWLMLYPVLGYVISNPTSLIDALKSLAQAYPFDIIETPEKIIFQGSYLSVSGAIDHNQMGAATGYRTEHPFRTDRIIDNQLPNKVEVSFIDLVRQYQTNTEYASRQLGYSKHNKSYKFAITLPADEARMIADRLLYEPWSQRLRGSFETSIRFNHFEPGMNVSVKVGDSWQIFKIENKKIGANNILKFDVISNDPYVFDGFSTPSDGTSSAPDETISNSAMFAYYFNPPYIASLGSSESATFAVNARQEDGTFRGGAIYRSTNGGVTFDIVANAGYRNITGTVQNIVGNASHDYWDRTNTMTVQLDYVNHELISLSQLSVQNKNNWCWVGSPDGQRGEIIGFTTVSLISNDPKVYLLSGLLRGLRATEHNINNHQTDDIFVYLSNQSLYTFNYGYGDLYRNWIYKAVPQYANEADITTTSNFTNIGERAKPRSPVHGRGYRNTSGDLTITWVRRTRLIPPGVGNGPVALDEAYEQYEIDIYNSGNTTVVRTIIVDAATTYNYLIADQTSDGVASNPINVRIYQISPYVGRGHVGVFVL